ncbi:MAG: sulfatase activating formylglycine-generating enzyme [Kiritimatiellia bacterium]|jgi:formylglycine-generating enzyme required for sulfatase activity
MKSNTFTFHRHHRLINRFRIATLLLLCISTAIHAKVDFLRDVKPVLEFNCVSCHQETKVKGKLRLDTEELAFAKTDVINPGKPDDSSLYWMTTLEKDDDDVMPPWEGNHPYLMPKNEQEILKEWIADGAEWPDGETLHVRKRLPEIVDFVQHVQPIMEVKCVKCHNPEKTKGKLLLHTKGGAFAKSDVLTPGDALGSSFWALCTLPLDDEDVMPPDPEEPLDPTELAMLRRWIEQGAPWPDGLVLEQKKKAQKATGISPQELYVKLSLEAGPISDSEFKAYDYEIKPTDVKFTMLPVEGGVFLMGEADNPLAAPPHKVQVDSFMMAKSETTWDMYELWQLSVEKDLRGYLKNEPTENDLLADAVTRCTPAYTDMTFGMGKQRYPAICMTQLSAKVFCMWLSAKTGHFYRLPTAAEWEYACRGGTSTKYFWGDDPKEIDKYAWYTDNSDWQYQRVATKKPNPLGLYDMIGNVWEWVLDDYDMYEITDQVIVNPLREPDTLYNRTVRGGGWDDKIEKTFSAARLSSVEDWKKQDPQIPKSVWYHTDALFVGFRVVRPKNVPSAEEIGKFWPTLEEIMAVPKR